MLQGMPCGQEVDKWALGIIMYAMMAGRLPFSDTDEYKLQHKIRHHEAKYPTGISKEAELIMRRVNIINIKTEALHVLEKGYHVLSFPWTCPLLKTPKFPFMLVFKNFVGCEVFLTLCCYLNCSRNVLG